MAKMKMLKDWNYAEQGVNVSRYDKGKTYEVDERCVELCNKQGYGEQVKERPAKKEEKEKRKSRDSER